MHKPNRILPWILGAIAAPTLLFAAIAVAQPRPASAAQPLTVTAPAPSEKDVEDMQEQLIKLLRLSPTLTSVVAHDPSLLSDQEYVNRNNPQLAQFLALHPEIARNPEFYLFSHLDSRDGRRSDALQRAVWPELSPSRNSAIDIVGPIAAACAFACFLGALLWLARQFIESRRWNRIFKLQSDVHGRLIERFSSNQELAAYMGTEAGRRFLEAAPIPLHLDEGQHLPNAVTRILTPIQAGIVLVLLGAGFLLLRGAGPEMYLPMLILGTVALMPGIGFIISAGVTWVLARRLGLMPNAPATPYRATDTRDGE